MQFYRASLSDSYYKQALAEKCRWMGYTLRYHVTHLRPAGRKRAFKDYFKRK